MREIRPYGSEGGGPQSNAVFLPLFYRNRNSKDPRSVRTGTCPGRRRHVNRRRFSVLDRPPHVPVLRTLNPTSTRVYRCDGPTGPKAARRHEPGEKFVSNTPARSLS